jgi:dipeptidase D
VLTLPLARSAAPGGWTAWELAVSGLKGGHSGVQIHEPLANAIKLLTQALRAVREPVPQIRIARLAGGNAHNAVPRDAAARFAAPPDATARIQAAVGQVRVALQSRWRQDEPGLQLELRRPEAGDPVCSSDASEALLSLLEDLPHGVLAWSEPFPGKVETSSNLAQIETREHDVEIATSSRSFVDARLAEVQASIRKKGEAAGASVVERDGYRGWEPDPNSRLLQTARATYRRLFGGPPEVQVIHAGLECGVIVSKYPGMEAISIGPSIDGAHTPEERIEITSVGKTWKLLTGLVDDLSG